MCAGYSELQWATRIRQIWTPPKGSLQGDFTKLKQRETIMALKEKKKRRPGNLCVSLPSKGFREEVRVHFGRVYIWIRFKQNDEKGLPV